MPRRKSAAYMSAGEQIAGTVLFVIYLLVLPFVTTPLFRLIGGLLGVTISTGLQNILYYYILFAATVIIFHGFLGRTSRHFAENLGGACKFMAIGLVALYGLNELVYRLTRLVVSNQTNLNDTTISAQIEDAPHMTLLIVIFLAPFVEEVLFRGLVFGNLRRKSAAVGYLVSCLLFALLHVWQFAVVNRDITYFLLMLQYLVPGLVLAWVYDRTGTLWTSIGLHAAANALSDVYAMGGEPRLAMNLLAFPSCLPVEAVGDILAGGADKVAEAGAVIAGGHSIEDQEPKYGLCVTGFAHPDAILTNSGAKEGDVLLLTKPIGIGILTSAMKADLCSKESTELAMRLMTTLNKNGRDAMVKYRVHACTDVTGFALMGHLLEMAQGSDLRAEVEVSAVDLIPEALEFARMGVLPAGMYRNRTFAEQWVDAGQTEIAVQDMLYDPQTSGGLLMAVDPADADALLAELKGTVPSAQRVGVMRRYEGGARIVLH